MATVQELINQLSKVKDRARQVRVWLPGERISLSAVLLHTISLDDGSAILIEGKFDEESAVTLSR